MDIINRYVGESAAAWCADYSVNQDGIIYDDWYLPSKYELDELYIQYQGFDTTNYPLSFANFSLNKFYWSSSEYDSDLAYCKYFYEGSQYFDPKGKDQLGVFRAIRSFRYILILQVIN